MVTFLVACSPAEKVPETTGATEEQPTAITEAVIEESTPPASDNVIKITANGFEPKTLTVKTRNTVKFFN